LKRVFHCEQQRIARDRLPAAASPDQPHDDEQDHRAERRSDDLRDNPGTEMNSKPWKQQARNEGADNADDDIPDQAEAGPLHNLAGQPARYSADQ
jgi:hypothetical protein